MNSESGQRLSVEELKRLNLPPQSAPMLPAHPPQQEWSKQLARLERLEASAGGGHASGIEPTGGAATHSGAVGDTVAGGGPAAGDSATGWEKERALYLAAQFGYGAVCAGLADLAPAGDYGGHGGLADHLVLLGLSLERGQGADPVIDSTTMHRRSDRKTLRREQEKKIALGHKEDDHEEEQTWQQTM